MSWKKNGIRKNGENIRALIVGIDPGTNTGIAILDMHKSVIHISSRRSISKSGIVRVVTKFGRPLIVAVDVEPAPKNIEKIANSVGAVLFTPEKSMSVKEKRRVVKVFVKKYEREAGIKIKFKNRHERDALAAALKAWKSNHYMIRKVENALKKEGLDDIFDDVVQMILKEESENITNAINKILKKRKSRKMRGR